MIDVLYFVIGVLIGSALAHFLVEISNGFDVAIDEHSDTDQVGAADIHQE